jgi:RNA polymerase sigma-70 factor (ECF subfamily)
MARVTNRQPGAIPDVTAHPVSAAGPRRDDATDGPEPAERAAVERARGGDEEAWRELFDQHYPRLLRFFRARVDSEATADDLAAEAFSEAYRGIQGFRWRNRPFGAWLFGIARNRLRMHYRSRRDAAELPDNLPQLRDEYIDVEIKDALAALPDDQRAAIEYRYILGLSGEEAAAALGRSHGAFRALLHRATLAFKQEYGTE